MHTVYSGASLNGPLTIVAILLTRALDASPIEALLTQYLKMWSPHYSVKRTCI